MKLEKFFNNAIIQSKEQVLLFIKGIILGLSVIIPGVSAGTILMVFGIYQRLLNDLMNFNIRPYISMGFGGISGIFLGSFLFSFLFINYSDPTYAFILGSVITSIPFILKRSDSLNFTNILLFIIGVIITISINTLNTSSNVESLGFYHMFLGGFVSSSAMMLPGVSGSAILLIVGIYENMLEVIKSIQIFELLIFSLGALSGIFILAKILRELFNKYKDQVLFFFSGLILGSSTILIPSDFNIIILICFILGGTIVYKCGAKR